MDLWRGCVAFPVVNGRFGDADLLRNLLLEQSEIESPLSDMVT